MGLEIARGRAVRSATRSFRKNPDDAARGPVAKLNLPGPKAELRFPIGQASRAFYRRFWPGTGPAEWNDWRWQMRARIRTLDELARIFRLSEDEYAAVARHQGALPVGITPYYASLMGLTDSSEPLRRTHIMTGGRISEGAGRGRRPARARTTTRWCRAWCTAIPTGCCSWPPAPARPIAATAPARGWWAIPAANTSSRPANGSEALAYLEAHSEVRDVLLSGGDPLTLSDDKLDWLLGPPAGDPAHRIPAHRHQDAGGDAAARHAQAWSGCSRSIIRCG